MKPFAYYMRVDWAVDWSKVCDDHECQRFPNRCDHVGLRVLFLRVVER